MALLLRPGRGGLCGGLLDAKRGIGVVATLGIGARHPLEMSQLLDAILHEVNLLQQAKTGTVLEGQGWQFVRASHFLQVVLLLTEQPASAARATGHWRSSWLRSSTGSGCSQD